MKEEDVLSDRSTWKGALGTPPSIKGSMKNQEETNIKIKIN